MAIRFAVFSLQAHSHTHTFARNVEKLIMCAFIQVCIIKKCAVLRVSHTANTPPPLLSFYLFQLLRILCVCVCVCIGLYRFLPKKKQLRQKKSVRYYTCVLHAYTYTHRFPYRINQIKKKCNKLEFNAQKRYDGDNNRNVDGDSIQ